MLTLNKAPLAMSGIVIGRQPLVETISAKFLECNSPFLSARNSIPCWSARGYGRDRFREFIKRLRDSVCGSKVINFEDYRCTR